VVVRETQDANVDEEIEAGGYSGIDALLGMVDPAQAMQTIDGVAKHGLAGSQVTAAGNHHRLPRSQASGGKCRRVLEMRIEDRIMVSNEPRPNGLEFKLVA